MSNFNIIICSIHSVDDETDGKLIKIPFGEIDEIEDNEHGNGYYVHCGDKVHQITDYIEIGNRKSYVKVTEENFYIETSGTFIECETPTTKPKYISTTKDSITSEPSM